MCRLTWQELRKEVAKTPDWSTLRQAIHEVLHGHVQGSAAPNRHRGFNQALDQAIVANTGAWYGAATSVGDEMLRDWCTCHTPWINWEKYPLKDSLKAATTSILEEAKACFAWDQQIVATIQASELPEGELDSLPELVVQLVDKIVDLGIHDSWYQVVTPVVAWTLERHGYTVDKKVEAAIYQQTLRSFTSWSTPAAKDRQDFADEVALKLLDNELARRWPDAGGQG